jgi:hypothetical protein
MVKVTGPGAAVGCGEVADVLHDAVASTKKKAHNKREIPPIECRLSGLTTESIASSLAGRVRKGGGG